MKVILTGATGMVGEGVLLECLQNNDVDEVLVITRRPSGYVDPKLKEIIHNDLSNIAGIKEQLKNYDGCLFCAGVSSVGKKEEEYYLLTYTLTMNFAETLCSVNPEMVFCYISGAGTDSTEKGKLMWARVKGKTENDLMKLPFKKVYAFRPGFLKASDGAKHTLKYYKYVAWLYPLLRIFMPKFVSTLKELGTSMINSVKYGYNKNILEVTDIIELAKK